MADFPGFTAPPVWQLQKHDGKLVAGEREFKGRRFFELRLWAGESCDKATKKGVTMPLEAVPGLANALAAYVADEQTASSESGS